MKVNNVEDAKGLVGIGERLSIEYDLVLATITSSASKGLHFELFSYDRESPIVDIIKKYLIKADFEVEDYTEGDYRMLDVSWI